uniref:GH26 domain-containing protein n=1 Tax=uncultured bacterium contig00010(2014) TaxID=1465626 RepID=A0A060CSI2_9BACT|nr:hypothetical protein [uncultured bacterium contig00010(2014)]
MPNPDLLYAPVFQLDALPCVPNANVATKALYSRLKKWWGSKSLSGSMAQSTVGTESDDFVYALTGLHTAIATFDFMNVTRETQWASWDRPYSELVANAIEWASDGGIVSCMWHWRDPSGATDEFYCKPATDRPTYTTFDVSDIFNPLSEGYSQMMTDIDKVATYLKPLRDAGLPILWRPMHEAQGNRDSQGGAWFWWGNGSGDRAAACKELWRVMWDRMTNHHGLNNLLWVWTNQLTGTEEWYDECTTWYPGGQYVDIIGVDIYADDIEQGRGSQLVQFKKTAHAAGCKKMVALTECGYIPNPAAMFNEGATWLWWMPWNGDFTTSPSYNGDYWPTAMKDSRILNREDI